MKTFARPPVATYRPRAPIHQRVRGHKPNPIRGPCLRLRASEQPDEENENGYETSGICLSDDDVENLFDDLDALKERLSLVEEIEKALQQIEARVDQLDTKLVGLCDSDMERSMMMQQFLAAREEEEERATRAATRRKTMGEGQAQHLSSTHSQQSKQQPSQQPQQQPQQSKGFAFDSIPLSHPFHLSPKKNPGAVTEGTISKSSTLSSTSPTSPGDVVPMTDQEKEREKKRLKTERAWENYRGSFTIVLTKGYLQAVDNLRQRMMIQEYETNLMHIARRNGLARFEAFCAANKEASITFAIMEQLYENPKDLSIIQDEHLRMRCQSLIRTEEMKMKEKCYQNCTEEARRLAGVFSKTDFLAKVLPDPIEHGLVSSVETLMAWYKASKLGGGS